MTDRATFSQAVQEALQRLHERGVLDSHPLTRLLSRGNRPLTGRELRQLLLDRMEQLKPEMESAQLSPSWRRYRHLVLRYLDGRSFDEICRELSVSTRQARRDHAAALASLVDSFWASRGASVELPEAVADDFPPNAEGTLDAELARLISADDSGPTSVLTVLRSVLETIDGLIREKGVRIDERLSINLTPVALGRSALRQILLRVLIYVAEVSPGASVTITGNQLRERLVVTFRLTPRPRVWSDPPAHVQTGFLVSRRLAEMRGGELRLRPERGPLDTIELALVAASVPAVLVVDDSPGMVRLYSHYLASRGYRAVQATNAEEALRLARDVRPRAITLDVLMPSHDGWEVLRDLRADPVTRSIPVVVCSIVPDLDLARAYGVQGFLLKPVTQQKLWGALESVLSSASTGGVTGPSPL
jgi:CheY-like chemotaxis protein